MEAFGELPPEVAALGKPMSVHPPSAAVMMSAKLDAKFQAVDWSALPFRIALAVLTFALPFVGCGFTIFFLLDVPMGNGPPSLWLTMPLNGVVFGGISAFLWWRLTRNAKTSQPTPKQPPKPGASLPGVIIYLDALVHVCDGKFTMIRWDDVQTIDHATGGNWCITAKDGSKIELPTWIEDDATAIESTIDHVTAMLLPQYLDRIDAGKKVMFGPFGVSKRYVYYKDKKADWNDVTSMRILTGVGYSLQIFCGWPLPWCSADLLSAPNGQMVYKLMCEVAPKRLLKQSKA